MHRNSSSRKLAALGALASTAVALNTNATVIVDPNDYVCTEEFKSAELGLLQARIFANKKSGVRSLEGEWYSRSTAQRIKGFWRGRDFRIGNFIISYNGINSSNKVRIQIGDCYGNQNICGTGTDYATDFRLTDGNLHALANWGAVVSIGRARGDLYIQIQDEAGAVLREDKLPVATLLQVENEMTRLMGAVVEKESRLKDQCMARKPLNTPPR